MNINHGFSYILIISIILLSFSCQDGRNEDPFKKKVGEITIKDSLEIKINISKVNLEEPAIFYISPLNRTSDGTHLGAKQLCYYFKTNILAVYDETQPGAFNKVLYFIDYIPNVDSGYLSIKFPSNIFPKEIMQLWSAYQKGVMIEKYHLTCRSGTITSIENPYKYILVRWTK